MFCPHPQQNNFERHNTYLIVLTLCCFDKSWLNLCVHLLPRCLSFKDSSLKVLDSKTVAVKCLATSSTIGTPPRELLWSNKKRDLSESEFLINAHRASIAWLPIVEPRNKIKHFNRNRHIYFNTFFFWALLSTKCESNWDQLS